MSTGPSLYRRHRPRTFADVVGQEHVVRTLRNAVEHGQVHHAYLFVGSRGTGKTSMAKILAGCLNCVNGPTIEPCGVCDSCVSIANATSMDVIEMDAASNNSVDDIRDLRESVAYAPVSGRSKVYILDEAHMLSSQAWNAFLKTLEEPPPNTIFVLATTEAQKVLPTVVDRCHRFDFGRPTAEQLAAVLRRVAEQESIEIGPDAVALIARHATGSFRDALGTLEQLVTYSGSEIAIDDVLAVLGVADADAAVRGGRRGHRRATRRGAAGGRAAGRVGPRRRPVPARPRGPRARAARRPDARRGAGRAAITPERDDAPRRAGARAIAHGDVVRLLDLLAGALRAVRDGADARTQLELALVKAAAPDVDPSTRALLARIERLEASAARGDARRAAATPVAAASPAPAPPARAAAAPPPPAPSSSPPANGAARRARAGARGRRARARPDRRRRRPRARCDLDGVRSLWPAVLDALRGDRRVVAAALDDAQLVRRSPTASW